MNNKVDFERRFSGVRRLYGDAGLAKLNASHVVVIGIGGVGSWAAEALARNGVGSITLIDLDNIAESNVNRQIHALDGNFGKPKVTAMRERLLQINPSGTVHVVEDFITPNNMANILSINCDVILDCTDDVKAKVALASYCQSQKVVLMMSGSAGGRLDPTLMTIADLAFVTGDKLLAKVRNQLRRNHAFPKASNIKKLARFGIPCVYSNEEIIRPETICDANDNKSITGLNCAGYGSSVSVTASFGFALAQLALNELLA